jgi:hypothetical protein
MKRAALVSVVSVSGLTLLAFVGASDHKLKAVDGDFNARV